MSRANPPPLEIEIDPIRNRLGQEIAALCAVRRACDYFKVTPPSFSESPPSFKVWRDNEGRVRCSCDDYVASDEAAFRCEHILAVKHFLLSKPIAAHRAPDGSLTLHDAGAAPSFAKEYADRQRIIRVIMLQAASAAARSLGAGQSPHATLMMGLPEALLTVLEECGDAEAAALAARAFLDRHSARRAA